MSPFRLSAWLYLPAALLLWPIVARDYTLRRQGLRPDRWHWADRALFQMGWVISSR